MDEFGSSICHSDEPNIRCAPFFYLPFNVMYSIIWPIGDLKQGGILFSFQQKLRLKRLKKQIAVLDEVTRDYLFGIKDPLERQCRLIPWVDNYDYDEGAHRQQLEPNDDYFTVFFYSVLIIQQKIRSVFYLSSIFVVEPRKAHFAG